MDREDIFQDDTSTRSPLALDQGTLLDEQFRVGRVLGVGGFGITYLAFDEVLEMVVAVKEYLPNNIAVRKTGSQSVQPVSSGGNAQDFEFGLKRFLKEARTLAKFEDHDNIVRVRTFFEENGTGYFVMNFYEGRTLAEYLAARNGFIPEEEALLIIEQVLDGLGTVHEQDILHRDIDPNNVYLADNGTVVLLDFGAARAAVTERTQSMSVVLKRGYAPHEQYHSRGNQGPWTDVYACSATMYHALTGYKPPEAASRMLEDDLVAPSELTPSLSDATNEAILRGLSIQPEDRPQSIEAFRSLLPDLPADAQPGWVGKPTTTDLPSRDTGGAELQLSTTHACRLYVDGSQVGELNPQEEYVIGAEPGSHRLRAVRTDQETDEPATVTAANGTSGTRGNEAFMSLDDLVWKEVVTTSPNGTPSVQIDFHEEQASATEAVDDTEVVGDPGQARKGSGSPSTAEAIEAMAADPAAAPRPSEENDHTADAIAEVDAEAPTADASDSSSEKETASEAELNEMLKGFADRVPGFIATAVVEIESKSGVVSHSVDPDFDTSQVNRAYTDFVQSNRNALDLLGADPFDTTDILISTNGMYFIAREFNEDYYMGLAISQDANLALARQTMASFEPKLLDALSG
jgi:serine/threonine protein kinase/predicted regulator of Ras-like GTPase activity (Roadblock/LC7/MglB family)